MWAERWSVVTVMVDDEMGGHARVVLERAAAAAAAAAAGMDAGRERDDSRAAADSALCG